MPSGHGQEGETVRRILDAAADEFARHGFIAARIRDIVDAAGVNLAAVNYHFGGKEGLYRETLAMLAKRTQADVPRESAEVRALPAEEQLRIFSRIIIGRFLGGEGAAPMSRILAHELLDPTPEFDRLLAEVAGPQFERLTVLVAKLLGPQASAEEISLASFSVAGQWAFYLFGRGAIERRYPDLVRDPALVDRLAARIGDFSIAALHDRRARIEARDSSKAAPAERPGREGLPLMPVGRDRRKGARK